MLSYYVSRQNRCLLKGQTRFQELLCEVFLAVCRIAFGCLIFNIHPDAYLFVLSEISDSELPVMYRELLDCMIC